jgi:hypothetical protein
MIRDGVTMLNEATDDCRCIFGQLGWDHGQDRAHSFVAAPAVDLRRPMAPARNTTLQVYGDDPIAGALDQPLEALRRALSASVEIEDGALLGFDQLENREAECDDAQDQTARGQEPDA